jgi:hypothetical protein
MSEPIPYTTTRYRCPHCRKSWAHKATATKHLPLCFSDPERHTCKTCVHDVPASGGWDPETGHDDYEPRHCAEGLAQGPSCIACGEHPDAPSDCWHQRGATRQLRVLCPAWEAKP